MSELVITLIEQVQREGQLDAVELLAWEISESISDDFERRVSGSGPDNPLAAGEAVRLSKVFVWLT